jgi:hypothetical protein
LTEISCVSVVIACIGLTPKAQDGFAQEAAFAGSCQPFSHSFLNRVTSTAPGKAQFSKQTWS